jgi:hypothetical protein
MPWARRDFLVAVLSNKYTFTLKAFSEARGLYSFIWCLKGVVLHKILGNVYHSKKYAFNDIQLQDERLKYIYFFLELKKLNLFGHGWHKMKDLPPSWGRKFQKLFTSRNPNSCKDKLKTLRRYKFCLCIENAQFPGYVTEKIIEAIVAGVVPVYLGAPDIENIIPCASYINMRNFKDPPSLLRYLESMSEDEALSIINGGRKFLIENPQYSYEGFAKFIHKLFIKSVKKNG